MRGASGTGTVEPFICDPAKKNAVKSEFVTVPKTFGFGGDTEGVGVVASEPELEGGVLMRNFKGVPKNVTFKNLEFLFLAPENQQQVIVTVCFTTAQGDTIKEVTIEQFHPRNFSRGWKIAEADPADLGLANKGKGYLVKGVQIALIGRGNIKIGNTKINYTSPTAAVHPKDLVDKVVHCPKECK